MNNQTEFILIECSQDTAFELRQELATRADQKYQISERKNLDGADATWIIVATMTLQALPHILGFLSARRPKLPTKIKVGEIEIENPSKEDIERLRKLYAKVAKAENNDG